jgi:hypothetical protein
MVIPQHGVTKIGKLTKTTKINSFSGHHSTRFALPTKSVRWGIVFSGPAPPCATAPAKLIFAALAILVVTVAALAMLSR